MDEGGLSAPNIPLLLVFAEQIEIIDELHIFHGRGAELERRADISNQLDHIHTRRIGRPESF